MINKLSMELDARVRSELTSDERLVWSAQPHPGAVLRSAWHYIVVGLVLTIGSTLFALYSMKQQDESNRRWNEDPIIRSLKEDPNFRTVLTERGERELFDYLPWLFVPVGIGIMTAPLWLLRRARRTCYALTDKRAIICEPGWFGHWKTSSYMAHDLGRLKRRERPDGSGNLIFEEIRTISSDSHGRARTHTHWRGFLNVANVREVEKLVRSTLLTGE